MAYLPIEYKHLLPLKQIHKRTRTLYTLAGLACTTKELARTLADNYHGCVVWPFEQALMHYGAIKFGLQDEANVTERCAPYIDKGNELLDVDPIAARGNPRQLWSVAAAEYFAGRSALRHDAWL
ncbi:MAG TPA: hypothetical protein VJ836_07730 [Candidatus Saccharimonadales bacterium]|nr:hypothetical protein [Candidatus Saccharimonadales bacterium]